ncbi:serine--tRNA ligase [Patescibacteria group bacterium]|nr:serine--tRNA ligase [Patescibacteria group bacterium]
MLDIKLIRKNPTKIKKACLAKQVKVDIDKLLEIDKQRVKLIQQTEKIKAVQNQLSKNVAKASKEEKEGLIKQARAKVIEFNELKVKLKNIEQGFNKLMLQIPNPSLTDVKVGKDESDNEILETWGDIKDFNFKARDHLEIGKHLDLIDIERSAKVAGSRFAYLKNQAVILENALIRFVFDWLSNKKNIKNIITRQNLNIKDSLFQLVIPPIMVKKQAMQAMGYLERGSEEIYQTIRDNLYLVGTAEQSIGPMHMDEVFDFDSLPIRYVAFSTCFRREAGSYGKMVRGIFRVHQFNKIEMFSFCSPDKSVDEHKFLLAIEKEMVRQLGIPYQVIAMCTGDLGDPAAAKYDIECWLPSQNKYRETHSTSNCTDWQARRLNIRCKDKNNQVKFIHTLNGTGFAIGRILIAILENYQQKDKSVVVPKVLRKYTGFKKIKLNRG